MWNKLDIMLGLEILLSNHLKKRKKFVLNFWSRVCSFKIKIQVSKSDKKRSKGGLEQIWSNLVGKSHFGKFQHFFVAKNLTDYFKESFLNRSIVMDF